MKILAVLILVMLALPASAQWNDQYTASDTATTSWTTIEKDPYQRIFAFEVANDNPYSSTNVLYVAFDYDTSATRRFVVKSGEILYYDRITVNRILIRADTGTVLYRARYY